MNKFLGRNSTVQVIQLCPDTRLARTVFQTARTTSEIPVWWTLSTGLTNAKRKSFTLTHTAESRLEDGILITGGDEGWKTEAPPDTQTNSGVWKTLHRSFVFTPYQNQKREPSLGSRFYLCCMDIILCDRVPTQHGGCAHDR